MLEKPWLIAKGMIHRFPDGHDPFQIMTRLLEECGELVQQVNHFQDSGVKRERHGRPDRDDPDSGAGRGQQPANRDPHTGVAHAGAARGAGGAIHRTEWRRGQYHREP